MEKAVMRPEISVIIGFKDWGLDRLDTTIRSILDTSGALTSEVVVSDYGSQDHEDVAHVAKKAGAKYVYTPTNGVWSRSRALNAGYTQCEGDVIVATDADMVFAPGTVADVAKLPLDDPTIVSLLQCRDLPEGLTVDDFADLTTVDWEQIARHARLRPRWGMGGFVACHRRLFERVRGLDERMEVYGGEDIDFATRLRRAGARLQWVDNHDSRMYHIWHPSSREAIVDPEHQAIVDRNREIVYKDASYIRNLGGYEAPRSAEPLVSVVIATKDRPEFLVEAVASALYQTLREIEVVVIDDASKVPATVVLADFDDDRIVIRRTTGVGVSAARNLGTETARGQWIAVLDDDDLMPPWRLERQLAAIRPGDIGAFGSFANFDETGTLSVIASKRFELGTVHESGGAPGHGTWLVHRDIMELVKYDERLESGVDNDFALRMLRVGGNFRHSGELVLLRRMHPGQITATRAVEQESSASAVREFIEYGITLYSSKKLLEARGPKDYVTGSRLKKAEAEVGPFLPDAIVKRSAVVVGAGAADKGDAIKITRGGLTQSAYLISDLTWPTLARLRRDGTDHIVLAGSPRGTIDRNVPTVLGDAIIDFVSMVAGDAHVIAHLPGASSVGTENGGVAVEVEGDGIYVACATLKAAMALARTNPGSRVITDLPVPAVRTTLLEDRK